MKQFIKALLSWPVLALEAAALSIISWPWANHWVSYFWLLITAAVLVGELLNYLYSPKKQTLSNNVQDEGRSDPRRFWVMVSVWVLFSLTLAGHFCLGLF